MKKNYVIGIAGGTASGKTTLASKIEEKFKDDIVIITYDNYYKSLDYLPEKLRSNVNFDHPDSLDTDLLLSNIIDLMNNKTIESPIYDFKSHTRCKKGKIINPKKVIIIEGILAFYNVSLNDLMDLKIFVDEDSDVRLIRRINRDLKERGRDLDSILKQYSETVKPMHDLFVEPSKKNADITLNGGINETSIDIICCFIQKILSEN